MINRARWRWSANVATRFAIPAVLLVASMAFAMWWRWGLALTLPLLAIAVWDFFQDEHTLRRNYPLLARVRWAVFFALATVVIFLNARIVPPTAAVLWVLGVAALFAIRWRFGAASPAARERGGALGAQISSGRAGARGRGCHGRAAARESVQRRPRRRNAR